ncbi:MAG: hypothetical protein JXB13_15445 [Phycisphaerae bacterium]|nr:hypothetical protein [Phycisphaerae bacterium]
MTHQHEITIETRGERDMHDVTREVAAAVRPVSDSISTWRQTIMKNYSIMFFILTAVTLPASDNTDLSAASATDPQASQRQEASVSPYFGIPYAYAGAAENTHSSTGRQATADWDEEAFSASMLGMEVARWDMELDSWTDLSEIDLYRRIPMNADTVRQMYEMFRQTVVTPPAPDAETYAIADGTNRLAYTEALCRRFHNCIPAMPAELSERYGRLMWLMRGLLFIDYRHIPLAIRHDRGRDVFWSELHAIWLREIEQEYQTAFGASAAVNP